MICMWNVRKVKFLGVVMGLKEIRMKEKKVKEILDWPTPKRVKDIQKFFELTNYYWQFIKNFIAISRLLHDLVKKNQK